ncbi:MAG TPA: hypothetical protein VNZ64_17810 [Candidatus Acidoferrum sp.]|jgi:hypothetical protein|nr:hypothetical protein [Candidatus Acidoferrum sp.]
MDPIVKCPKCGELMEQGFTVGRSDNAASVVHWFEGVPEYGFFGGIKATKKRQFRLQTFRCSKCGFLESYAPGTGA